MRLRLQKGKQTELILLAKNGKTWANLANILELSEPYVRHDLKKEKDSCLI